jgi:hypothetical protein
VVPERTSATASAAEAVFQCRNGRRLGPVRDSNDSIVSLLPDKNLVVSVSTRERATDTQQ